MIFFSFNDIDLLHNMQVDCHMQWHREWGPMAALGRLWPPWLMGACLRYLALAITTVPSTIVRGGAPGIFPSGRGIFPSARGKNLDFSLHIIPTVGAYEK